MRESRPDNLTHLVDLPRRNGPRPRINPWPVPHRMANQFVGTEIRHRLDALFAEVVAANPETLGFKLSFYETHNPAITLGDYPSGHAHATLSHGEVAHIHPSDGSMHMVFSPADAKTIVEAGWGERHPLAGVLPDLPDTYLFVYPPRDELELRVVKSLLLASVAHMSRSGHRAGSAIPQVPPA